IAPVRNGASADVYQFDAREVRILPESRNEAVESQSKNRLLRMYFPGVAGAKQFGEVALAALGLDVADLVGDEVFVARDVVPGAKDADGSGEAGTLLHVREEEGVGGARMFLVVNEKILFRDAVAELDDFEIEAVHANALVAILAEDERLAVLELDDVVAARVLFGDAFPRAVIEDVAVLQDFDVGRALVRGGFLQSVLQMLLENVHGAGQERRFRANRQRNGIERAIRGAEGS